MSRLKELTWEHHKEAERQGFVKVILSGKIHPEFYATYLWNQHKKYDLLEALAGANGLLDDLPEVRRKNKIEQDYLELWPHGDLSGGQMIAKRIPGEGRLYHFDKNIDKLKEAIRQKTDDSMADEARICFTFATKLFQDLMELDCERYLERTD